MKKLISLCIALVMALALTVPASAAAADAVTVQVNGQEVVFPNGRPEVVNDRTMVPMRAVLEALGAEVDYDAETDTARAVLGDISITHVIGTNKIDIAGQEPLTMDAVSYVKNDSTLVPLRFFSQALGYEVYWDEGANTAVVIDKAAVVAKIDENFTILNSLQTKQAEALDLSGNLSAELDFSGEIKLPEVDAQPFSMKMSALYGSGVLNAEGTMDLSVLAALVGGESEAAAAMAAEMLKDLSFKIICGESMWFQMPVLTAMMGQNGDVWIKTDASDLSAMNVMSTGTIGSYLYALLESADADVPVFIYDDLVQTAEMMTILMGDETFVKDGDDYSWTLDEAKSASLADALSASSVSFPFTMEMTVKADGGCDFSLNVNTDEITMSVSGTSTNTDSSIQGKVEIPGACEVTFQGEAAVAASDTAPVAEPPAGAAVIDAGNTADVGVIGGADGPTGIFTTAA